MQKKREKKKITELERTFHLFAHSDFRIEIFTFNAISHSCHQNSSHDFKFTKCYNLCFSSHFYIFLFFKGSCGCGGRIIYRIIQQEAKCFHRTQIGKLVAIKLVEWTMVIIYSIYNKSQNFKNFNQNTRWLQNDSAFK